MPCFFFSFFERFRHLFFPLSTEPSRYAHPPCVIRPLPFFHTNLASPIPAYMIFSVPPVHKNNGLPFPWIQQTTSFFESNLSIASTAEYSPPPIKVPPFFVLRNPFFEDPPFCETFLNLPPPSYTHSVLTLSLSPLFHPRFPSLFKECSKVSLHLRRTSLRGGPRFFFSSLFFGFVFPFFFPPMKGRPRGWGQLGKLYVSFPWVNPPPP